MEQRASPPDQGVYPAKQEQPRTRCCCGPAFLKRSLLLFWAVWFTVVFLSNAADAAKAGGLLDESWAFASGNYRFISDTTARYGTSSWANAMMFAGVIAWEALAAFMFWKAGLTFHGMSGRSTRYAAFIISLSLWGAFMIADEIFIAYPVEGTHLRLLVAHLVTLLTIELLPES